MRLNYLFGAVAACGLLAGAAYAQPATSEAPSDTTTGASGSMAAPTTEQPGMSGSTGSMSGSSSSTTSGTMSGDQATPAESAAPGDTSNTGVSATSATTYGQSASVTTTTLTNGPVPDTRENREKFGGPNSAAGRRTAPKGN